jgi:hypothetical protein
MLASSFFYCIPHDLFFYFRSRIIGRDAQNILGARTAEKKRTTSVLFFSLSWMVFGCDARPFSVAWRPFAGYRHRRSTSPDTTIRKR